MKFIKKLICRFKGHNFVQTHSGVIPVTTDGMNIQDGKACVHKCSRCEGVIGSIAFDSGVQYVDPIMLIDEKYVKIDLTVVK